MRALFRLNLSSSLLLASALIPALAAAAPPPSGDTRSGGAGIGGFTAPPQAEYDPTTTAEPGLLDRRRERAEDQTYGPTGQGDQLGHDIIDPRNYVIETGWNDAGTPDYHVVQEGDTLSGICAYYYGDMYLWPKIWSYNPHITNAHWIFPGDRLRLTDPYDDGSGGGGGPEGRGLGYADTYDPRDSTTKTYLLERYAFIDESEISKSMEVIGGAGAAIMMGTLDTAYVGYDASNPPIPGERLSVYRKKQPVYDIKVKGKNQKLKQGKRIGWLVEVVGEVYVHSVAEKSAEAEIVESIRPVERGHRVGELKTRFTRVSPSANAVTTNGLVVETIREHTISGETQFVVINLGAEDGIRRGNTLDVVQKGDAYTPDHRLHQPYDKGHPRRVFATLLVLQIEGDSALTVVTDSLQEIVVGNHVEITAAGALPEDFEAYEPSRRDDRRKGDGSVEASGGGGLRVGN